MAASVEWLLHPDLGRIVMHESIRLLPNNKQGLAHDSFWKLKGHDVHGLDFVIPTDTRWDAGWAPSGQIADTKLKMPRKQYVYLSHREYLEQQRRTCLYPIFQWAVDGYSTELMCLFDFQTANSYNAINRFEGGNPVFCEETQRVELPWSINLYRLLRKPEVLWFDEPR